MGKLHERQQKQFHQVLRVQQTNWIVTNNNASLTSPRMTPTTRLQQEDDRGYVTWRVPAMPEDARHANNPKGQLETHTAIKMPSEYYYVKLSRNLATHQLPFKKSKFERYNQL